MKKIEISFSIKAQDSKQEFITIGEYKNNRIKFVDPDNNTNYIIIKKDIIEYYKKGNVDMKYIFKTNTITKGLYNVYGNHFMFDISTSKIELDETSIHIEYDLIQDGEVVNNATLDLSYFLKEE